jgi:hypothetical protein
MVVIEATPLGICERLICFGDDGPSAGSVWIIWPELRIVVLSEPFVRSTLRQLQGLAARL